MKFSAFLSFGTALLLCAAGTVAVGETRTWVGGPGDWYDPAQWDPCGHPDFADELIVLTGRPETTLPVTVCDGGSVTLVGGAAAASLDQVFVGFIGAGSLSILDGATVSSAGVGLACAFHSNGTVLVEGPGATWDYGGQGYCVGEKGSAALTIRDGGLVTGSVGIVGDRLDGVGHVTVTGQDAVWRMSDNLFVGHMGSGTLAIQNGGRVVVTDYGSIGHVAGGVGLIGVEGAGSLLSYGRRLHAGFDGHGTLEILDGAAAEGTELRIGGSTGSEGRVTVRGAGSSLTCDGQLRVGEHGTGRLEILDAAAVTSVSGYVGCDRDGRGDVVVEGEGSKWTVDGDLDVGYVADGSLTIGAGALVVSRGADVGMGTGGRGTVTVSGMGAQWELDGLLRFDGTLVVAGGGTVHNVGKSYFGENSGASASVAVGGEGSVLAGDGWVFIGKYGNATLDITDGALVCDQAGYVAWASTSESHVTVDGAGSQWVHSGPLYLGGGYFSDPWTELGGDGRGTLVIRNGAEATDTQAFVAFNDGSEFHVTVTGPGSRWLTTGTLEIAHEGTGTLEVTDGGEVISGSAGIGMPNSTSGAVTVRGHGSTWATGDLTVGWCGNGRLTVAEGGTVGSFSAAVGFIGGEGRAVVEGPDSVWSTEEGLVVGAEGDGLLEITGGGRVVTKANAVISEYEGTGRVVVHGPGSAWEIGGMLTVGSGHVASGTLEIAAGGHVQNGDAYIATTGNTTGRVTVEGPGSTWVSDVFVYVGQAGTGAVTIRNGGRACSGGVYVGCAPDANGTVLVEGPGATWDYGGHGYYVGDKGPGSLVIRDGGLVTGSVGAIGNRRGSVGHATVTGEDALWSMSDNLFVGHVGRGTLAIALGGTVTSLGGCIGCDPGGVGQVSVQAEGSTWDAGDGLLFVGHTGTGTLEITGGATVTDRKALIGWQDGSDGTVLVDGPGSRWTNATELCMGGGSLSYPDPFEFGGAGTGKMVISNGAWVSARHAFIGHLSGSSASVVVDDATWRNSARLWVGCRGDGTLEVVNGGMVTSGGGNSVISGDPNSIGVAIVDGRGSWWSMGEAGIEVGSQGSGTLKITGGGQVCNGTGYVGYFRGASGHVLVNDATWQNRADLIVGCYGAATLEVVNGGRVLSANGQVGQGDTSSGVVTVDRASWTAEGDLWVGVMGSGTMEIRGGGRVSDADGRVGCFEGGTGLVVVTGPGSEWIHSGSLCVGGGPRLADPCDPDGNETGPDPTGTGVVHILRGGYVGCEFGYLGCSPGASGRVTVEGPGAALHCETCLHVGLQGSGTLEVAHRGTVTSGHAYLGSFPAARGHVEVRGVGSAWELGTAHLYVATRGVGTMEITDGGRVACGTGYLAFEYADGEATAFVAGGGALWEIAGNLFVAGYDCENGGAARLEIGPGGTVSVGGRLWLWPDGAVVLNGGTLRVAEDEPEPFVMAGGTFEFLCGMVEIDGDAGIDDSGFVADLFGPSLTIPAGKGLGVTGKATLLAPVTLDGGTLSVGEPANLHLLRFDRGTLRLTRSPLTIGPDGLFGATLSLGADRTVDAAAGATVDRSGRVELDGGLLLGSELTSHGVIEGTGTIGAAFTNAAQGQVRASEGDSLRFSGPANVNLGRISVLDGTVEFDHLLVNEAGGSLLGRGRIIANGGLINRGQVSLSAGITDVFGQTLNDTGGKVVISGQANVTFWDDVCNQGDLFKVAGQSSVTFFGAYGGAGISGLGDVYFEGDVTPGLSPAAIDFEGSISFGEAARLAIEMAGSDLGDFDRLTVAGAARLEGTLDLALTDGFEPGYGEWLEVLAADTVEGSFGHVDGVQIAPDKCLAVLYEPASVLIVAALPGDADLDGDVDVLDYLSAEAGFGTAAEASWHDGDFDGDGDVDFLDYFAAKEHFGQSAGGPPSSAGGAVPAPATLLLLAAAAPAVLLRRRCRSRSA